MEDKIKEILNNVEFLHGVPVQAPQKTVDAIIALFKKEYDRGYKKGKHNAIYENEV